MLSYWGTHLQAGQCCWCDVSFHLRWFWLQKQLLILGVRRINLHLRADTVIVWSKHLWNVWKVNDRWSTHGRPEFNNKLSSFPYPQTGCEKHPVTLQTHALTHAHKVYIYCTLKKLTRSSRASFYVNCYWIDIIKSIHSAALTTQPFHFHWCGVSVCCHPAQ